MSFQIYFRDEINKRERMRVCVSSSEEEWRNTTVEELKRKLIPEDQYDNTILVYHFNTLKKNRTLGSYGIEHEDEIRAVRRGSMHYFILNKAFLYSLKLTDLFISGTTTVKIQFESSHGQVTEETLAFEDDDDEDKEISRTQSIEHLALMQQIEHHIFL
ncbi:hypothetical protein DPX16_4200 [Anabarilius grahami]|uniref:Ubiquitin-like domain-containing protein n=1 Tax=Anabarilius grahami TaxID=495550 RepID=A0A3N0YQF2_ANAGA|nr:hypothetical protein DPX16_4200 [Anabarilius grahami]